MPSVYSTGNGSNIPELTVDPVSPIAESAWVLKTSNVVSGQPMGLLLALTYSVNTLTYLLSYRTLEGTTVRTSLIE